MITAFAVLLIIFSLQSTVSVYGQNIVSVTTDTAGTIRGNTVTMDGKVYNTFLGIPYAQPPIGKLRFQDPQPLPPQPRSYIIDASKDFSKMCVQGLQYSPVNQSEDCLYLNVMVPKISNNTEKYAVMFWIHGGFYVLGSASEYYVDGIVKNIVSRNIAFVSINYRLNSFGFFSTKSPVAAGNYGLLDQIEALKWVQKNIAFFGGDPRKVTIFGESAGGISVSLLSMSPLAKGLFSQGIMMSGSALTSFAIIPDEDPENVFNGLSESLNCRQNSSTTAKQTNSTCPYRDIIGEWSRETLNQHETELKCLQSKSTEEIASKFQSVLMRPRVDGKFISRFPDEQIKTRDPLTFMIGVTKDEWGYFVLLPPKGLSPGPPVTSEELFYNSSAMIECKQFKYPALVNFTVRYHYGHLPAPEDTFNRTDEKQQWFQRELTLQTNLNFYVPAYLEAAEAEKTKSTVYLYSFDYKNAQEIIEPETQFHWIGAPHFAEIYPLFGAKELGEPDHAPNVPNGMRDRSQDAKATEVLGQLWTNFAKYGNPTPTAIDNTVWQPFTAATGNYLSIDFPQIKAKDRFYESDIRLFTELVPGLTNSLKEQCDSTSRG